MLGAGQEAHDGFWIVDWLDLAGRSGPSDIPMILILRVQSGLIRNSTLKQTADSRKQQSIRLISSVRDEATPLDFLSQEARSTGY